MKSGKWLLWTVCAILLLSGFCFPAFADQGWTELVVLSTTDMHGKCWETDILTGKKTEQNMLRVSTAVREIRKTFGAENVILLDNGDLFQGTPVSETHLLQAQHPDDEPEVMALCLTEMDYDALILGNHEFNYPWSVMRRVYDSLEAKGVPVLAANAYYDGTDGIHQKGENAFGTYIIRHVTVNGHDHRIGILGLENTDIPRWDLPANYPGIQFFHPDSPDCDLARETGHYIEQMRAEGCEMIIVSYHGGLGADTAEMPLSFGISTDHQGLRIIRGTDHIDLMILGHDHSTSYSRTFALDRSGQEVPIVNGGGQDLTRTVFRLTEDRNGALVCELLSSENVILSAFEPDHTLEEKIRPHAELADSAMEEPVGMLTGDWDGSGAFYTAQTDTMDLISAAMMDAGTVGMGALFDDSGLSALQSATGLDHLDVDASFSSVTGGTYIPSAGPVSRRDIARLYPFSNELLVLPMYGRDIRTILEENAASHLSCRILGGKSFFFIKGSRNANLVSGGINFRCDMAQPAGERITIEGFANGRSYDPDAFYLVAVNSYNLGNESSPLRRYSEEDALWSQHNDGSGDDIRDSIRKYIARKTQAQGSVSPEAFPWRWSLLYSGDPAALPSDPGRTVARRVDVPEDGHRYILYQEPEGCTFSDRLNGDTIAAAVISAEGDCLTEAIPEDALIFTVLTSEDGAIRLRESRGRFLTCGESGGLALTEAPDEESLSLWRLIPMDGGFYLLSSGARNNQAIEFYNGRFSTYQMSASAQHLFNFYEIQEKWLNPSAMIVLLRPAPSSLPHTLLTVQKQQTLLRSKAHHHSANDMSQSMHSRAVSTGHRTAAWMWRIPF